MKRLFPKDLNIEYEGTWHLEKMPKGKELSEVHSLWNFLYFIAVIQKRVQDQIKELEGIIEE